MQQVSDWAVKRLLKALLKRHLKHILATELDTEQLHFSLGKGRFELKDVLVSPEWLAGHAPPGLDVVSGYIGRLALDLAVTSLTCAVQLEDVLLTVRPGNGGAGPSANLDTEGQQVPAEGQEGIGSGLAEVGMDDGLRLVAAGVETLLQRMTVTVNRLSVRVEGAADGRAAAAACMSCAQLTYGLAAARPNQEQQQQDSHAASTARRLCFSSLCLLAQEGGPPLLAPLNGQVDVTVSWLLDQLPDRQPHLSVAVSVEGVQLQLRPPDVVALLQLARGFTAAATQPQQPVTVLPNSGGSTLVPPSLVKQENLQPRRHLHPHTSTSSFLEDLMLPGCKGLVQEALLESAASVTGQEELNEYFDAKSLLGSLQQAFSSAMASSFASVTSTPDIGSSVVGGSNLDLSSSDIFAMHDLAASIRQVGAVQHKHWDITLSAPSLALSLLYTAGELETASSNSHSFYAPRLVVEALSLTAGMHTESADGGSGQQHNSSRSLSLTVGVLEVAEHLPFPSAPPNSSATGATTSPSTWVPAEEMARVPAMLPSAQLVQWSLPTFAGDYPLPGEGSASVGIGDTLAQLSDLSQATVYQSAAATITENSMLQQPSICQDIEALPRVQIVPVLHCGSHNGAALVLHCSNALTAGVAAEQHQDVPADVDVALMLQPVSIWCTLPLLAHLQSFFLAAALLHGAVAPSMAPAAEPGSGSSSRAAVDAAISAILHEHERPKGQQGATSTQHEAEHMAPAPASLRLSVYLPAACIIVAVPEASSAAPLPQAPPNYFALDVRSSSYHLLASMAPRLGSHQAQALAASLRESGVQPTVVLQQGGSSSDGISNSMPLVAAAGSAWTCALRIGAGAVHAVAVSGSQLQPGDSFLGPALLVAEVASMEGEAAPVLQCLTIDACWRHAVVLPAADLLDSLWASAGLEPGCQPDQREQLISDARLVVAISGQTPLALTLEPGVLASASKLADGLLQLSTVPPPMDAATQATLLLDCEVQCTLIVPHGPPFSIVARSVSVLACSGMSGVAGSSAVALTTGGIELARAELSGPARLLLRVAGRQLADGRRQPAAHLFALLRPTGDACMLCSNGRYVLPCRGRVSVCTTGLTAVLDEAGQLAWLADLQGLSAGIGSSSRAPSPARRQDAKAPMLPSPPPVSLDWVVNLSCSSVRYEPRDTSLVAAVLTVASIAWQSQQGRQERCIEARRLTLHLAATADNDHAGSSSHKPSQGDRSGSSDGLASWTLPTMADVAGFHQILAEAGITVRLPGAGQHAERHAQQATAVPEIAISNKELSIALSRHTFLLLQRLVRQLPASVSGSTGNSASTTSNSSNGCHRLLELSRCSMAADHMPGSSKSTRQEIALNVMQGVVQSAYASPQRPVEHQQEASVFLDGGWYDPQQAGTDCPYIMSPAGSPPAMVESFVEGFADGGPAAAQEEQGVWYDGIPGGGTIPELLEEYVTLAAPGKDEVATSFGSADYDCRVLRPSHVLPKRRITLQDISITIMLADTFATVLLPEDERDDDLERLGSTSSGSGQLEHHHDSMAAPRAAPGGGDGGGEEEVVPLSAQVQARLEGVCLQLDSFAEQQETGEQEGGGNDAPVPSLHCALVVRNLEVRDSFQPRQGGTASSATAAAATGWSELRRMLGYHASVHRVRGGKTCMVQFVVEAIRAEPGAELEYRIQAQLLPLLLHLDQAALAFLQHFFAPTADGFGGESSGTKPGTSDVVPPSSTVGDLFFQRCEVQPFTLTINYRPHRVDLTALSSGQLSEVLNLVPWGGVSLQFRHLRLFGIQGLAGIGTSVASAYVEDIARFQAHRFVGGIAPIKSICRVSSAAAQLLAIPKQQLYARSSHGGGGGTLSLTALVDEDFRRQMQRGLAGFVRAVALEALNLGATMAAGAEVALAGESSASHTAGVKQALRQASAHLRSSSIGPRSAASAAATAMRTALLGVRNTLDREHAMERRLNS